MNSTNFPFKIIKLLAFLSIITLFLNACNGKIPGGDARKNPVDPKKKSGKKLS